MVHAENPLMWWKNQLSGTGMVYSIALNGFSEMVHPENPERANFNVFLLKNYKTRMQINNKRNRASKDGMLTRNANHTTNNCTEGLSSDPPSYNPAIHTLPDCDIPINALELWELWKAKLDLPEILQPAQLT